MLPPGAPLIPGQFTAPQPPQRMQRVIVWLRHDLRVSDNPALAAALQIANEVVRCGGGGGT